MNEILIFILFIFIILICVIIAMYKFLKDSNNEASKEIVYYFHDLEKPLQLNKMIDYYKSITKEE